MELSTSPFVLNLEASSFVSSLFLLSSVPASFVSSHPFSFQRLCFVSARKLRSMFCELALKMWKIPLWPQPAVTCGHSSGGKWLLFENLVSAPSACSMGPILAKSNKPFLAADICWPSHTCPTVCDALDMRTDCVCFFWHQKTSEKRTFSSKTHLCFCTGKGSAQQSSVVAM